MTLGVQKLAGTSGKLSEQLPNFASDGINIPGGLVLHSLLPTISAQGQGSVTDSAPFSISGTDITELFGTKMPWTISFWIRIASGGGGMVMALSNPGYLFLGSNITNFFDIRVTETQIQLNDNLGFQLSTDYELNKENDGWQHIWIVYDRDPNASNDRRLYVNGRNIGWQNSANNITGVGGGYAELSFAGNRQSVQVGVNQVITLKNVANGFDICHFGIWGIGNDNLRLIYPAFDPGTDGHLDFLGGGWSFGTGNGRYPAIWAEFNFPGHQTLTGYMVERKQPTPKDQTTDPLADIFTHNASLGVAGPVSLSITEPS